MQSRLQQILRNDPQAELLIPLTVRWARQKLRINIVLYMLTARHKSAGMNHALETFRQATGQASRAPGSRWLKKEKVRVETEAKDPSFCAVESTGSAIPYVASDSAKAPGLRMRKRRRST